MPATLQQGEQGVNQTGSNETFDRCIVSHNENQLTNKQLETRFISQPGQPGSPGHGWKLNVDANVWVFNTVIVT